MVTWPEEIQQYKNNNSNDNNSNNINNEKNNNNSINNTNNNKNNNDNNNDNNNTNDNTYKDRGVILVIFGHLSESFGGLRAVMGGGLWRPSEVVNLFCHHDLT